MTDCRILNRDWGGNRENTFGIGSICRGPLKTVYGKQEILGRETRQWRDSHAD
ncbi:hypothetical protein D3OALGA1CA_4172 [Olavius algarvensis associated proteobacterium Delta 3]|nr:hypothetical protein D3OALGB2SA_1384 [Olavius algarvensis associated proteobacterium Delta 3]CAB5146560.1 hypothetical protein D3OALGA1CA_4172 [Olavius algarvensis associated proteobacterium Delta 3]